MAKKKDVSGETQVWAASAWWRDSDPSMQVVTLTSKKAETAIQKIIDEAARYAAQDRESYKSIKAALRDIAWSGVSSFRLRDLAGESELPNAIQSLEDDGVWYPESL